MYIKQVFKEKKKEKTHSAFTKGKASGSEEFSKI